MPLDEAPMRRNWDQSKLHRQSRLQLLLRLSEAVLPPATSHRSNFYRLKWLPLHAIPTTLQPQRHHKVRVHHRHCHLNDNPKTIMIQKNRLRAWDFRWHLALFHRQPLRQMMGRKIIATTRIEAVVEHIGNNMVPLMIEYLSNLLQDIVIKILNKGTGENRKNILAH